MATNKDLKIKNGISAGGSLAITGDGTFSGTANPTLRLQESSGSQKRLDLSIDSTGIAVIAANQSAQEISIKTVNVERLRINAAGISATGVVASSAQFTSAASSASLPALAVSTGTGIYNNGANILGVAVNSANVANFTTSALTLSTTLNITTNNSAINMADAGGTVRRTVLVSPSNVFYFGDIDRTANTASVVLITAKNGGNLYTDAASTLAWGTGGVAITGATSTTGTMTASSFSGAGTGLTGTASALSIGGNATTATTLQTARNINGVSFNGSADITVTAAAGTLTGTTLNSTVTGSSLTSVGTLTGLTVSAPIQASGNDNSWGTTNGTATGAVNAVMGTGASATWLLSGTSGGVFRFGIQGLDAGGSLRIYSGTNYLSFDGINLANGAGSTFLTSANYTGYAPTLTGTGASGSWGISVTGNAATATTATTANALNTANNYQVNSLGVGTAASGTAGEIRATNNITAYYSDDRLKTRLGNIENALEKVATLSAFYYEANETAQALGYEPVREVGLSAQQMQKIMPEITPPAPIDDKYLTIRYERVVPLLVAAINELQDQVKAIKAQLENRDDYR